MARFIVTYIVVSRSSHCKPDMWVGNDAPGLRPVLPREYPHTGSSYIPILPGHKLDWSSFVLHTDSQSLQIIF